MNAVSKNIIYWCLFLIIPQVAFSQNNNIDSLKLLLRSAKPDSVKLGLLVKLSSICEQEEVLKYAEPALELADKILLDKSVLNPTRILYQKAEALYNMGLVASYSGISGALDYHQQSLKIREQIGDKEGIASSLNDIGNIYHTKGKLDKALEYYNRSLKFSEETNNKGGMSSTINNIGGVYYYKGDIPKAMEYYLKSLKMREEAGEKKEIANSLNNIAAIYSNQGDIPKALGYFGKGLKMFEEIKDKDGIAWSLTNIGVIYFNQGDLKAAIDYYTRGLKIREEIDDRNGIALTLHNIAAVYLKQNEFSKALEYMGKGLKIQESIGDKQGVANSLNNIGSAYLNLGDISLALAYYQRSLKLQKESENKKGTADIFINLGRVYLRFASAAESSVNKNKNLKLARSYADSSFVLAKEMGYPFNIRNAEIVLSKIDSTSGNFASAFEHYKQYIIYRDSINNTETRKAGIKSQLKYEYEKKEAVIKEQQEKERVVADEKNRRQQIAIWSVAAGLLLVIGFAFFVFRSLKVTRHQKIIIEEKQKDILDSIRYAKRIQQSLLPSEKYIAKNLNRLFKN